MIQAFNFAKIPKILFGAGTFNEVPDILRQLGRTVLIVTGASSHKEGGRWEKLTSALEKASVRHFHFIVKGEPSPELVDGAVAEFKGDGIDAVLSWGGGSVVDAGKAISAMLPQDGSVFDYLEGVGTDKAHNGVKVPFIAVPTTSGTGSEATKNAVLSRIGPGGFKKSLRHDNLVPDIAVLDPELVLSCPPGVTAACGMDAFTQLLESYVSTGASPMTDALAFSGLERVKSGLVRVCADGAGDLGARQDMAYAALISGITLANAGLGLVHGLASPIGGAFEIPHGVVCGALMGLATEATIGKLKALHGPDHPALRKFSRVGAMLRGVEGADVPAGCEMLVETIREWTRTLKIPRLGEYGITESDLDGIVSGAGNKNNPVPLEPEEIRAVLQQSL